jgi:hypothetical protein
VNRTRVVVTLEMADILEVEEICLDEDAAGALTFVKERVKPQIDAARKAGCDAQFGLRRPDGAPAGGEGRI